MEFWEKQKKVLAAFGIFLAFMFVCTLISRAVYASGLPQVTVECPKRTSIGHKVEAEGLVRQGREYALNLLPGLRVKTVHAHVGDRVTLETLLFELDTADLKQKIEEQEIAIKKLQLQISDQESAQALAKQDRQTGLSRAQEDYGRAAGDGQQSLQEAEEDLQKAEAALNEKKGKPVPVTPDGDRAAAQEKYEAWIREGKELKAAWEQAQREYESAEEKVRELEEKAAVNESKSPTGGVSGNSGSASASGNHVETEEEGSAELEKARRERTEAKKRFQEAESAYQTHMEDPMEKPDFSEEDSAHSAWEAEIKALEEQVTAASRKLEAAKRANRDAMVEAGRKVEDENREDAPDSNPEINRLELSALQETLHIYEEILKQEGRVYPEAEGVITQVHVAPGERAPDGAAVVYADLSSPMRFYVALTKEQKKYVNQGDTAKLSLGGSPSGEYSVDYIGENEANPELYDAYIILPEGTGAIGQSGVFEVIAQSETYSCCIPISALHEDNNHRNFVYTVSEKEGILGKELAAEIVYVKVLDQNDAYAAIEEGVVDSETKLIVSSTEALEDRAVIRYRD